MTVVVGAHEQRVTSTPIPISNKTRKDLKILETRPALV
jgi:hypothetical protein